MCGSIPQALGIHHKIIINQQHNSVAYALGLVFHVHDMQVKLVHLNHPSLVTFSRSIAFIPSSAFPTEPVSCVYAEQS